MRESLQARGICILPMDLLKRKALLYSFWSFFSFVLKKIFSLEVQLDSCINVQWRKCVQTSWCPLCLFLLK